MRALMTCLLFLVFLCDVGCANIQDISEIETSKDTEPPVIDIKFPRQGERYVAPEYRVKLTFTVTDGSRLQKVLAEVIGEHTGIFFTIYGGDYPPSKGHLPVSEFDLYSPVFEGRNTLKIIALDRSGNRVEASTGFYVYPLRSETVPIAVRRKPIHEEEPEPPDVELPPPERYDLLILAHEDNDDNDVYDFVGPLLRLVAHKNSTGMRTKLLTLREIYETPQFRGRDHAETIKKAIAIFKNKWKIKYVMLVGDADMFPVRYTKKYDLGHWGHRFVPSDLYYADLFKSNGSFDSWDYDHDDLFGEMQSNFPENADDLNQDRINLFPDVAVGRIPVSNYTELDTYVDKVISYETTSRPSWFKRALLITGDYPGSNATNNYIASQLASQSFEIVKKYHDVIWPTTTLNERELMIKNELDAGVGFVSYVGHGAGVYPPAKDGGVWAGWYSYDKIPFLNNMDKLPVIFSAACSTAMFGFGGDKSFAKWGYEYRPASFPAVRFAKYRWAPQPIALVPTGYDVDALAEHFLVKHPVGGIAFIGSYTGTQGDSHTLAKYFFEAYASGTDILGDVWNAAIEKFVTNVVNSLGYPGHSWYTAARYHHIHKMLLFGDPSLRLGGVSD